MRAASVPAAWRSRDWALGGALTPKISALQPSSKQAALNRAAPPLALIVPRGSGICSRQGITLSAALT